MRITLRIKRVYFDAIREGDKTYELRADTMFYRRMLHRRGVDEVMLHYQSAERLYCEVQSIRLIKTPLSAISVIKTAMCWKLTLGKVRYENKERIRQ